MRYVVGITGASGTIYAKRLLEEFKKNSIETDLIATPIGKYNIEFELGIKYKEFSKLATTEWDICDVAADVASGSSLRDGIVVVPCSMNTVAKMAAGISDSLLFRCIDVMLKENRKIIIVPRESPLNKNHLENLLKLSDKNIDIIPPMTVFYIHPQSIMDIVDFTIARILDHLKIQNNLSKRWKKPNTMKIS